MYLRHVLLGTVVLGAAVPALSQPAMEHVLVSVPLHKTNAETALPITVLAGDELHRAMSSTLGDTLANTPGLAKASFGPGVGQPVIRGQQGSRVTVLQNGTSSADASNLSADHAVAVESMLADSIEILRGPATLLYGGGAIGGVVNVLDNRIPTSLEPGSSGGVEYRHDAAAAMDAVIMRADIGVGSFAWHADALYRDWADLEIPGEAVRDDDHAAHEDEDHAGHGFIDNSDGRTTNLTLGGSYHFEDGFAGLAVARLENEYGIPASAHAHDDSEPDESGDEVEEGGVRLDVEQTRYDALLHWHEPLAGLEVLRGFLTYTDYSHDELEPGGELGTQYNNETWEGRLEIVHEPVGPLHGVFGVQAKDGQFSALGEEAFIPKTESEGLGLFLLEDLHRGAWTFEAGLRVDFDERKPTVAGLDTDFTAVSGSASALWDIHPQWMLGLALSRAERAPAIEELYSNVISDDPLDWVVHAATGVIEVGDPDLDTEASGNADVSLHWDLDQHFIDVTLFYNDFSDYVGLINSGQSVDDVSVVVYAQGDAEFYGAEFNSRFQLPGLWGGALTLGVLADTVRGEFTSGGDVPRLPADRIGSQLTWAGEQLELWGEVTVAADQDRPGQNEEPTQGYTRWDLGADFRLQFSGSDTLLFLKLKNVGDEEIRLSTSFLRDVAPEGGRSLEAGIRVAW
jgi:iron complex outermembrane receptor protein